MKILVLNGSPRPSGNTAAMVAAFAEGARESGNDLQIVDVCQILEDMGIFSAFGKENQSEEKLEELRAFGRGLR